MLIITHNRCVVSEELWWQLV